MDEGANAVQWLYEARLNDLPDDLEETFEVESHVVDYPPVVLPLEHRMAVVEAMRAGDREAVGDLEDRGAEILGDVGFRSPRGKVLVQYRPAHGRDYRAGWRVWVEGGRSAERVAGWEPLPGKVFRRPWGKEEAGELRWWR